MALSFSSTANDVLSDPVLKDLVDQHEYDVSRYMGDDFVIVKKELLTADLLTEHLRSDEPELDRDDLKTIRDCMADSKDCVALLLTSSDGDLRTYSGDGIREVVLFDLKKRQQIYLGQ